MRLRGLSTGELSSLIFQIGLHKKATHQRGFFVPVARMKTSSKLRLWLGPAKFVRR